MIINGKTQVGKEATEKWTLLFINRSEDALGRLAESTQREEFGLLYRKLTLRLRVTPSKLTPESKMPPTLLTSLPRIPKRFTIN